MEPETEEMETVETRGDFFQEIATQEGRTIGVSFSDSLGVESCLLQINEGEDIDFTCIYLGDEHVKELRDALDAFLRLPKEDG